MTGLCKFFALLYPIGYRFHVFQIVRGYSDGWAKSSEVKRVQLSTNRNQTERNPLLDLQIQWDSPEGGFGGFDSHAPPPQSPHLRKNSHCSDLWPDLNRAKINFSPKLNHLIISHIRVHLETQFSRMILLLRFFRAYEWKRSKTRSLRARVPLTGRGKDKQ